MIARPSVPWVLVLCVLSACAAAPPAEPSADAGTPNPATASPAEGLPSALPRPRQ